MTNELGNLGVTCNFSKNTFSEYLTAVVSRVTKGGI